MFAGTKELLTPNGDHFRVAYPDSFTYEQISPTESGMPVAFTLNYSQLDSQETVDRFIVKAGARGLRNAVEKEVTPVHYSPDVGSGRYAVFTDPALVSVENPKSGDYWHLIMGVLRRGRYVIFLRGYTNSAKSDYFKSANHILEVLQADAAAKTP